ncbi:MAG: hypothetical protein A2788_00065 [Candidatus Abawacabacteria bacterium RIFCSPHIGHO2_01_FULL_46_8]|uniref:Cell shape-determining protein MreC n=1 Tax=Candidatus Abawacabacteria bacterium RIFCSPHIGHO2_01_FULL_46_8 TaxID=1817815 RepID=A0A1F4XKL3_9BACT|nr:MAG: hypothetical protein A2788_00065 [Candidatus Abawacabacteria bacterium RIFCSPHIGHO2_01_FULL_46_8]
MQWHKFRQKWHLKPFLISFGISLIFLVLHYLSVLNPLEYQLGRLFTPLQRAIFSSYQKISYSLSALGDLATIEEENRQLTTENARLSGQITKLISITEDNVILREQLKLQKSRERELVFAKLLGYYNLTKDDKILINVGLADRIAPEMPVILYDSLVGVIQDVNAYSAAVSLISNPKLVISAYVQGKPDAKGIIRGQEGSTALLFSHLDKRFQLAVGEFVVTTGQGMRDNRNILIGTIIEKIESDKDPYHSYLVSPALELEKLDTVFVVTSS